MPQNVRFEPDVRVHQNRDSLVTYLFEEHTFGIGKDVRAVDKLYEPKGYTHDSEDIRCSLQGSPMPSVAEFAHRSLSLLSPTTAPRNAIVSSLRLSVQKFTMEEVEENIKTFIDALAEPELDYWIWIVKAAKLNIGHLCWINFPSETGLDGMTVRTCLSRTWWENVS